jgi:pimeloyl-ACP methyl ester carboxylesterase
MPGLRRDHGVAQGPGIFSVRIEMEAIDSAYAVAGNGPPVFLVHGVGGSGSTWARLIDRLKTEFTCISYDLRGHGKSPRSAGAFELDDFVADLEALRKHIGCDRAHVIGHSLGGMIAARYSRHHSDRVISTGLLSTVAGRTDEERTRAQAVIVAMEREGVASALDLLVPRWFTDDFVRNHPDIVAMRKRQVMEVNPVVYMNAFRLYVETEMAGWLHEVVTPALVLTGELDPSCSPRHNRFIAARLPKAQLVILDGLRHGILLEAPERVAPPVAEFLRAHR